MSYPSLEQYNIALQSSQLTLQDPGLKAGRVKVNGMGLPLALCGGFALTYTVDVGAKKYALRCFHKKSNELERRYQAISARLKQLASPYFLPFEFIPNGIRVDGGTYPIVKMEWAQGKTLAEFLEREHQNPQAMQRLRQSLGKLTSFLESNGISHGDIQPENIMVNGDGSAVQLIDYDGMFVSSLAGAKATELGQVNFQHPLRSADDFDARLDRFSFLTLDVALQALIASPAIWKASRSEPSAVVFRRNDFLDPGASTVFREAIKLPGLKAHVENLAKVASGSFASVPTLAEFLQGKGISAGPIVLNPKTTQVPGYQGPYTVCDATNYAQVLAKVGDRIELIGRIVSVKKSWTKVGRKPYVFVNFSDWRGHAVKLSIWVDGMDAIKPHVPDESWVGRWISATGLVDPPYSNTVGSTSYTHLSITISAPGQIQQLTEKDARFRMRGPGTSTTGAASSRNTGILQEMGGTTTRPSPSPPPAQTTSKPASSNRQLLDQMRNQAPSSPQQARSRPTATPPPPRNGPPPKPQPGWGSWVFVVVPGLLVLRACVG